MTMASSDVESLHVLLLTFPLQGHINPLLQFGKRLASYNGVRCTLATTRFVFSSTEPTPASSVHVALFSDGCDVGGADEVGGLGAAYLERLESVGSETLDELLLRESEMGRPVDVVVYDAFLPWAVGVARRRGAACAAFLTQTCAVDVVYAHAWDGLVPPPPVRPDQVPEFAGLSTRLQLADLPTFLTDANSPPCFRECLTNQFLGLDTVDHVLINSFYELEPQEAEYLASTWGARTVGPTVPSAYLDNRIPDDTSYGLLHLHTPMKTVEIKAWLDGHAACSVLYAAFGSTTCLGSEDMAEIAEGLYSSNKPFLWVVRATETSKLPDDKAAAATRGRGLIVPWCQQLEVLAHPSVGCFMTQCGWNSTVEALNAGVPMVAMPHWSDQTTNAKYIQDVWRVGLRTRPDAQGVVRREEIERCVREVMEGERSQEFRNKAIHWSHKAKNAISKGGSSDINILDFLSKCRSRKQRTSE